MDVDETSVGEGCRWKSDDWQKLSMWDKDTYLWKITCWNTLNNNCYHSYSKRSLKCSQNNHDKIKKIENEKAKKKHETVKTFGLDMLV